jgi:hypothetical protein
LVVVVVGSVHLLGSDDLEPTASRTQWGAQAFAGDDTFADPALPDVPAALLSSEAEEGDQAGQHLGPVTGHAPSEEEVTALAQQRQEELQSLQEKAQKRTAKLVKARDTPVQIRIAVFNILGSNHTGKGSRYASGTTRAGWAAGLLDGFDFVGFSEIQSDQLRVMYGALGNRYDFYPGTSMGNKAVPTNVMWRSDRFELVDGGAVGIPFVGQTRLMPYVRLRDRDSKKEFWLMNAHNAPQGRQSERNSAVAIEIAKLRELIATGLPVFFMGDLNEKATVFCKVTGQLPMAAANGGSTGGGCSVPGAAKIDWLFGTTSQVTFSGYSQTRGGSVPRITDHHLVSATASVK